MVPSPWIGGGDSAKLIASLIWKQRHVGAPGERLRGVLWSALAPVLERHEGEAAAFSPVPEKLKPLIATDASRPRAPCAKMVLDLARCTSAVRLPVASAGACIIDDDEALVLVRQERGRQLHEQLAEAAEQRRRRRPCTGRSRCTVPPTPPL